MTRKIEQWLVTGAVGIFLTVFSMQSVAQPKPYSEDHLRQLNQEIERLTTTMTERAASYPDVIAGIREARETIEKADVELDKLIADLRAMTDKMDMSSEYHAQLSSLDDQILALITEAKRQKDENLKDLIKRLEAQRELTQDIEKRRAESVIEAKSVVRDLEDNKERLKLIIKIGHIESAVRILEESVKNFEDIVTTSRRIADDVTIVVSAP